jgi:L-rhamnose mutarotase
MQRMGSILGLKPEAIAEYKRIHADVWPEVLATIAACGIRNYTIFLKEPENLLFAYFEYHGTDFAADSAKMAADPKTQEWWSICMPMQAPLETRKDGEWWAQMEDVFHVD